MKKSIAMMLVVTLTLSLAACGGSSSLKSVKDTISANEEQDMVSSDTSNTENIDSDQMGATVNAVVSADTEGDVSDGADANDNMGLDYFVFNNENSASTNLGNDDADDVSYEKLAVTVPTTITGSGTVTIICPFSPGSIQDVYARSFAIVAHELQDNYVFVVNNISGDNGFAGAAQFTNEDSDAKELLLLDYDVCYRHDIGKQFGTEVVNFDVDDTISVASLYDFPMILYTAPTQDLTGILEKAISTGITAIGASDLTSSQSLALGALIYDIGGSMTWATGYETKAERINAISDGDADVYVGSAISYIDEVSAGTIKPILAFSYGSYDGCVGPSGAISVPGIAGNGMAYELIAYGQNFENAILGERGTLCAHKGCDTEFFNDMLCTAQQVLNNSKYYQIADFTLKPNYLQEYGTDAQGILDEYRAKAVYDYGLITGLSY